MQNFNETNVINTNATQAISNVVEHDIPSLRAFTNVSYHFEQLSNEREAWESGACRTSNDQLYALLQKCYQTYKAMTSDTKEATALRSGLDSYIGIKGLNFKKGTHTLVKIVRCVFGDNRRRVSAYGIVLRSALAQHISVMDIPAFIRDNGGVEEIRLAKAPNAMTSKQKAAVATTAVQVKSMGVFASEELGAKLDAGNIGKPVLLLGAWQADGTVIVRTVVDSAAAVNTALASYYSANKADISKQQQEQAETDAARLAQEAINAAVNCAEVSA